MDEKQKNIPPVKAKLIVTDEKNPSIAIKPGMKFQVASVSVVGPDLKKQGKAIAARLCGGSGTCVAVIEL